MICHYYKQTELMYKPLNEAALTCPVCSQNYHQLLAVASCPHRFCKNCSVSYIQEKAASLEIPRCLMEGCGIQIDKTLPFFKFIDAKTLHKLEQIQIMKFLKDNPDHAGCRTPNCMGTFLVQEGRCANCQGLHCRKCLNLQHTGGCVEEEENLRGLNFRKCPSCRIWVQKSFGCRFINCKCGTEFCYACGSPFLTDPCRKRGIWERELQIKQLMKNIRIQMPTNKRSWLLLIPRIGAALLLLSLIIVLVPLTLSFILAMGVLAALFSPLGLFTQIHTAGESSKRCFAKFLGFILLYPFLSILLMAGWIAMMVIYPFAHGINHHGVYDLFDLALVFITLGYLKFAHCLLGTS